MDEDDKEEEMPEEDPSDENNGLQIASSIQNQ
jgi:hypothetical protein